MGAAGRFSPNGSNSEFDPFVQYKSLLTHNSECFHVRGIPSIYGINRSHSPHLSNERFETHAYMGATMPGLNSTGCSTSEYSKHSGHSYPSSS